METNQEYNIWKENQKKRGINVAWVREQIKNFKVETPSWGYGNSGTRFKVFKQKGMPSTLFENLMMQHK